MPEPSKSDSECIAGLELPKQDNAHAPHPVSAAIIYAGVFTMTCALYSSILSACWGFLLIILPGYAIVPFIALLLTRKINASWNLLWLAGTTALTYAMTLVSMAALLMLIPPKATLWFSIVKYDQLICRHTIVPAFHGRVYNSDHLLHPWLDLPRIPQQPQSVTKNRRWATVKAKFMHRHCGTDTLKTYKGASWQGTTGMTAKTAAAWPQTNTIRPGTTRMYR